MRQKKCLWSEVLPIPKNAEHSDDDDLPLTLNACCGLLTEREFQKRGMAIKNLLICLICCWVVPVSGQSPATKPEKISIGQALPDLKFNTILNFPLSAARLSDFKGKPVILDFWATWCGSCVQAFPKMDSLQKVFNGRMQFLTVNYEGSEKMSHFIEKVKQTSDFNLPVVIDTDYALWDLFKVRFVPHYVWIDANGVLRAITNQEKVTSANIAAFINGDVKQLGIQKDEPAESNSSGKASTEKLFYSSALSGFKEGLACSTSIQRATATNNHGKISATNCPVAMLFRIAFSEGPHLLPYSHLKTILETPNNLNYKLNTATAWDSLKQTSTYCYELVLTGADTKTLKEAMLQDLIRYFPLQARKEQRVLNCLALVSTGPIKAKTAGGKSSADTNYFWLKLNNSPISELVETIQKYNKILLIDKTKINTNIDIDLKATLSDLPALKKELAKYNLDLKHTEQKMEVLVISEK